MTNATQLPVGTTEHPLAPPPRFANPFETEQQQYASGKLGMWIFIGAEMLMFGGLFCAYTAYRHNYPGAFAYAQLCIERSMNDLGDKHPVVFASAHRYFGKLLDGVSTIKILGGISTIVLIFSSLTMAWGLRCAQLGKRIGLILCMMLTLLGGLGFVGIKYIEYRQEWNHHLWIGAANRFHKEFKGEVIPEPKEPDLPETGDDAEVVRQGPAELDPLAGTLDEPKIKPSFLSPVGLAPATAAPEPAGRHVGYKDLDIDERAHLSTFFSIYFLMTGLHGLHLLVGTVLIAWIMFRAIRRQFSPAYFAPVDLVGLYWHLTSLIWIFLFPLLYLMH